MVGTPFSEIMPEVGSAARFSDGPNQGFGSSATNWENHLSPAHGEPWLWQIAG